METIDFLKHSSVKKTWDVTAQMPVSFSIRYSTNVLNPTSGDLLEFGDSNRRIIAIDKNVHEIYGDELVAYLEARGIEGKICPLDCSEEEKSLETTLELLQAFEDFGLLRRSEPVIGIGGGVLLDIVGFAASIYRRGVPYIRVPTTLLALVDASIGAKTGVNHFDRRNRLGSYHVPQASYIDKTFVKSQDQREICNGMAEIFKMAVISDAELFRLLEEHAEILIGEKFQYGAVPVRVINLAISGMVTALSANLWEKNLERYVDFGHSFSPMVEMMSLPELSHGEAVCIDCLFSSYISYARGLLQRDELTRVVDTARRLRLPIFHRYFGEPDVLQKALDDTKRHRNGNQNLPLPFGIGSYVFCNDLTFEEIENASRMMANETAAA